MTKFKGLFVVLVMTCMLAGCKKDSITNNNCDRLKQGLLRFDASAVTKSLTNHLASYSLENMNRLAEIMSDNCAVSTIRVCYGCIYTLPEISEIDVAFLNADTTVNRVIDVTYTSSNRMIVVDVHD